MNNKIALSLFFCLPTFLFSGQEITFQSSFNQYLKENPIVEIRFDTDMYLKKLVKDKEFSIFANFFSYLQHSPDIQTITYQDIQEIVTSLLDNKSVSISTYFIPIIHFLSQKKNWQVLTKVGMQLQDSQQNNSEPVLQETLKTLENMNKLQKAGQYAWNDQKHPFCISVIQHCCNNKKYTIAEDITNHIIKTTKGLHYDHRTNLCTIYAELQKHQDHVSETIIKHLRFIIQALTMF